MECCRILPSISLSSWKKNYQHLVNFTEQNYYSGRADIFVDKITLAFGFFIKYSPMIVINSTMINDPHPIQNIHIHMVIGIQKILSWLLQLGTVNFKIKTIGHTSISLIFNSWSRSLSFHLGKIICSCTTNPFAATPIGC